jgi:hypothetical protein
VHKQKLISRNSKKNSCQLSTNQTRNSEFPPVQLSSSVETIAPCNLIAHIHKGTETQDSNHLMSNLNFQLAYMSEEFSIFTNQPKTI